MEEQKEKAVAFLVTLHQAGITDKQIAVKLRCTEGYIRRVRLGHHGPSSKLLKLLEDAFLIV